MLYSYEASDKKGFVVKGEIDALNEGGVMEYLEKKDLIPVRVELARSVSEQKATSILSFSFDRVTAIDRIILVRNLAATIKTGLNIVEALDILIADAEKKVLRDILVQTKTNLENGQPLSKSFAQYEKIFPIVFVGMIRAGEISGHLDTTLDKLSQYLSREYNLIKKVKSAMAYPVILLCASFGVVTLLITFVLPRLAKTFKASGAKLPFITQVLISIQHALAYNIFLTIFLVVAFIASLIYLFKSDFGKKIIAKAMFRTPVVRDLIRKILLVRFSRTLGSLIASGISIVEALELSAGAVGNEDYRKIITEAIEQIKNGIPFSKTLEKYPLYFPRFLTSLILVGERTGTLEHILQTFSEFYDEEVDNSLKDFTSLIEPIMLLVMGLIIGVIAISILMPIYQLVGKFV